MGVDPNAPSQDRNGTGQAPGEFDAAVEQKHAHDLVHRDTPVTDEKADGGEFHHADALPGDRDRGREEDQRHGDQDHRDHPQRPG